MNTSPILLLSLIPFFFISCKRHETGMSYEERKKLPPEANAKSPQPPKDTGAGQTDGGTRSDYKPTTGPAGQAETTPATPPSGTNPSPSNPNVVRPPEE
ncbi:hypothetical protein JIN84_06040 [Luteolibacter yonseiensis]|uniref:Uncharacterized protein n=1 Tax=Luteolibacter yonseiensis TaxID=1144680 RepID=A0A934QYQ6_9BACT|nr:hypothetical protein [Luteolibacter yonseiensis]MBK1815163.1 hypothetical protein [Luteolibacter yonseiensis]